MAGERGVGEIAELGGSGNCGDGTAFHLQTRVMRKLAEIALKGPIDWDWEVLV